MSRELIDLHIHVGGAVAPHVLWSLAHSQGFKLPTKNYFEFVEMITARPDKLNAVLQNVPWTANFATDYRFRRGPLAGLRAGIGIQMRGDQFVGDKGGVDGAVVWIACVSSPTA